MSSRTLYLSLALFGFALVPLAAVADSSPAPVIHSDSRMDCCLTPEQPGLCPAGGGILVDTNLKLKVETDARGGVHAVCTGQLPDLNDAPETGAIVINGRNHGTQCLIFDNDQGFGGATERWHQVITSSGQFTLVCHFKPEDIED
jgi:hypothetical protein